MCDRLESVDAAFLADAAFLDVEYEAKSRENLEICRSRKGGIENAKGSSPYQRKREDNFLNNNLRLV